MGIRSWLAATTLILTPALACAPAHQGSPGAPTGPGVEIDDFTDESGETRFLSVRPLRVGSMPAIDAEHVVLSVGALYAHRTGPEKGYHALALVLRTRSDGGGPLFPTDRTLLLSVDGERISSRPLPGGHAYRVEESARGVEETIMVPVSPTQLAALAEADEVRGRLGPWFSFLLPRAHRRAVAALLGEIPTDVRYNQDVDARPRLVTDR